MKTNLEVAMERSNQTAEFQAEINALKSELAAERAKVAELERQLADTDEARLAMVRAASESARLYDGEQAENERLQAALNGERAKVALAVEALSEFITILSERPTVGYKNAKFYSAMEHACGLATTTLASLRSTDLLADIRREVARECAEIARGIANDLRNSTMSRAGAAKVAGAIKAKFGIKE